MLIDTHCHLDKLDLTPYANGVDGALDAARDSGVRQLVTIAIDLENFNNIHAYTARAGVFASCGVHPLQTEALITSIDPLMAYAVKEKVVAIGETGLDYFYDKEASNHQAQKESFALHLDVAKQLGLPTIVHTRDAKQDTLMLIKERSCPQVGGVLHCFTEDYGMAKAAVDLNYLISISGIVTFKNAEDLRETVKRLPLESLLVETDAPYLAPVPHRGKKNEPKYVRDVAQYVADLKRVRLEELLEITAANFHRKFTKANTNEVLV